MLLTIHDANLQKVGFIDNEKQETLNFYDDTWNRNLETASSTFEFTVSKKELLSDTANKPLYNQLNERSFVSFKYKGKTYLFNIMKTEENERWLRCYCENLNLELINEYTNPYKADRPLSFAEYLDVFEIPQFAMVTLGINEISDQKRTLEWEGQETKLARLLSLANKFDAEVEFVTRLNDDSSINQLILNVYHKADDSHTGVGRIRGDIRLTFEKNIKSMTRKVDKTEIYTLVVPYGKSKETHEGEQEVRVYIDSLPPWEEKNDEGIVIFKQEGVNLYAPHAADLYPSTFGVSTQSNKWIRKDLEVDSDNPNVIRAAGIANLRKHAYPAITYEVDGFVDVEIGDTITIHDKGFTPALDIRARAVEQKISFSNPTNNKTTFGNFKELENRTSGDLRSVFEQMVENIRPYNILVSTDNGVLFKNNTGQSTLRPTLKRGNQVVNATYRFVIDGSIVSSGLTYTVKASDITKPTVITISAWVDNKEVASEEVTFVNVSDGKQGPKGADGKTPYVHFAYADSADGQKGFSLTQTGTKRYLGVYTDFNQADSTNPADYTWSDTAGSVSVGGDNLIVNSAFPKDLDGWGYWEAGSPNENLHIAKHGFYYNGTRTLFRLDCDNSYGVPAASRRFPVKRNTDYSLNIQMFATENIKGVNIYFLGRKSNETNEMFTKAVNIKHLEKSPSTTDVVKFHFTFNSGECDEGFIRVDNYGATYGTSSLFFTELDCYEGTTDRSWQASPEDLKDEIDTKADNALTQAQLNKLSEINSVMKAELEAKASLATVNQWIKAYQDFVNANSADRAQAQKALADASARVVKLENNLNDMSERWNFIDNYMAASNDGLVIGKKDNSSSIMFNPNGRISMFSAGNEVMYISKGVIHIENGIFSKTIQIGRFREEQDFINPDRNVIRYAGGI